MKQVALPLTPEAVRSLCAGDTVLLSGVLYTARDAAHKRLVQTLEQGLPLPISLQGQTIYFAGPAPAAPGQVIGAAGPTTAYRMDPYSPALLEQGLLGMIGKGRRSRAVTDAIVAHGAVYFGAAGGCGALLARCIRSCQVVAYPELGTEAIHRLEVEAFPVTVVIDSGGRDLYDLGPAAYLAASAKT